MPTAGVPFFPVAVIYKNYFESRILRNKIYSVVLNPFVCVCVLWFCMCVYVGNKENSHFVFNYSKHKPVIFLTAHILTLYVWLTTTHLLQLYIFSAHIRYVAWRHSLTYLYGPFYDINLTYRSCPVCSVFSLHLFVFLSQSQTSWSCSDQHPGQRADAGRCT